MAVFSKQLLALGLLLATPLLGWAHHLGQSGHHYVSIIIDDLGDKLWEGENSIALPGALTYSILPRTTYSQDLAIRARRSDKEVMLHQPMEAIGGNPLGPGGITHDMDAEDVATTLRHNLQSVPYARGVNNHMGSLLTQQPNNMGWFMDALQQATDQPLYFIDSRTTTSSVAASIAYTHAIPSAQRNIFLDHYQDPVKIGQQFQQLIQQAQVYGSAIAIGHTYPVTTATLAILLPQLEREGITLVPVSELIQLRNQRSPTVWQASLSPLQPELKSSKP